MLIFNIFYKKKIEFKLRPCIFIYLCGVTMYDKLHVGHSRIFFFFDILIRYFIFNGIDIFFIRNITDIDKKIEQKTFSYVKNLCYTTTLYSLKFYKDCLFSFFLRPTFEPFATGFIFYIQCIIELLIRKNYTYSINNDIYFNTSNFNFYGFSLLKKHMILQSSLKCFYSFIKSNSKDFVLWKNSLSKQFVWSLYSCKGRPGWHIECTAMIFYFFGSSIDIHGGGFDLIFPHHENEYTQAFVLTNKKISKFWLHIGLLYVGKKKMSKSFLNFVYINTILSIFSKNCLRFFNIYSPYRKPLIYNFYNLILCEHFLNKIFFFFHMNLFYISFFYKVTFHTLYGKLFFFYMENDFNIPQCLLVINKIFDTIIYLKKNSLYKEVVFLSNVLYFLCCIFGFFTMNLSKYFVKFSINCRYHNIIFRCLQEIFVLRFCLRFQKQWYLADLLRYKLFFIGISIEDFYS